MNKLHIYLSHLEHNFTVLKGLIKPSTALIGVVKASAYGTDAVSIALCLEALGIDRLAVAYTAEGVALKKAGIKCHQFEFGKNGFDAYNNVSGDQIAR